VSNRRRYTSSAIGIPAALGPTSVSPATDNVETADSPRASESSSSDDDEKARVRMNDLISPMQCQWQFLRLSAKFLAVSYSSQEKKRRKKQRLTCKHGVLRHHLTGPAQHLRTLQVVFSHCQPANCSGMHCALLSSAPLHLIHSLADLWPSWLVWLEAQERPKITLSCTANATVRVAAGCCPHCPGNTDFKAMSGDSLVQRLSAVPWCGPATLFVPAATKTGTTIAVVPAC